MPVTQQVNLTGGFPDSEAIARELQAGNKEFNAVVGNAIADVLKAHFIALNAQRHHFYGRGFYEEAARGTGYTDDFGYPAVVVFKLGIAQRRWGGLLIPKNGSKYLAIPNSFSNVISEVYGRSPREFDNLVPVIRMIGGSPRAIGLAAGEGGATAKGKADKQVRIELTTVGQNMTPTGRAKKKSISSESTILFWLVSSVYQRGDESVLPEQDELVSAGRAAAIAWLTPRTPTTITVLGNQI